LIVKRNSTTLGIYTPNCHLFIFRPSSAHGNYSGYGFTLRVRRSIWRHLMVRLHCRSKFSPRARTYEVCTWRSKKPTTGPRKRRRERNRLGFKTYARLKISLGGPYPPE
jgi:hypothetical protein